MRLIDWQNKHKVSDVQLAEALGTTRQNVWAWKAGQYEPSARLWDALRAHTKGAVKTLDDIANDTDGKPAA